MTRVLLTPGIGNQLFQVAAAANCRAAPSEPANVVVLKRYLRSRHGDRMVVDFPFVTSVAVNSASRMDDLAYFMWQRFGTARFVRWISRVAGVWMENSLPRIDQPTPIDFAEIRTYALGCGYWQDVVPEAIHRGLRTVIDLQQLDQVLAQHGVVPRNRIHVRAGDYESAGIYSMLDVDYYIDCLSAEGRAHEPWEMVTDNPRDPRVQRIFLALKQRGFCLDDIVQKNAAEDFLRLISAKTLVCANSTFSVSAAYIRELRNGAANRTFVPATWFNTPSLKRPDFYARHWIVH